MSAVYKKINYEFEFHHRPLWDWIVAQLEDPKLASCFHWDAQRMFKFNGTTWVRFYEEPWTADMFWDVQVSTDRSQQLSLIQLNDGISRKLQRRNQMANP